MRAAREAANAASKVSSSGLVSMPLRPPQLYGVWHGCIVDGVAKLRDYLVDKWTGTSLPLVGGGSIYSYDKYTLTAAEYSQSMQVRNVLRWRGTASRNEAIHRGLPGSRAIDHEITKLLRLYFPVLDSSLEKFNGHLLRQYYEADGGSGFGRHIDEADDCTRQLLYLSVAVKLTDDPPGSDGTWMQVEGFQPVRYGCSAGSVVMFLSRWPHWSLRTPPNMGKVLKLVSFYRFREHSQLAAEYAKVAPADCAPLSDNANRAFSVLPQQDSSQPQQVDPVASSASETQQATEQEWFDNLEREIYVRCDPHLSHSLHCSVKMKDTVASLRPHLVRLGANKEYLDNCVFMRDFKMVPEGTTTFKDIGEVGKEETWFLKGKGETWFQKDSSQPQQKQPPQSRTLEDVHDPDWCGTRAIKSACNEYFDVFRPVLKLAWERKVGQRVFMMVKKVDGAAASFPFAQAVYGVCTVVRPTLPSQPPNSLPIPSPLPLPLSIPPLSHSNQCEEFSSLALLTEETREWPNGGRPLQPDEHPLRVRAAPAFRRR